jgi:hypothetical protein
MPSSEERMMILRMVEEGKVSPEEGTRLLAALGERAQAAPQPTGQAQAEAQYEPMGNGRYFRVRVSNSATGKQKVNVNIPLGLVDYGLRFVPASANINVQAIQSALRDGISGRIVDVMDDEKGDHVEVFIE